MAAHKKLTPQLIRVINLLVKQHIPISLIANVYKIHGVTVTKALLPEVLDAHQNMKISSEEKTSHLLGLLAWMSVDPIECGTEVGTPAVVDFKSQLYSYLKLKDWELYFAGAIDQQNFRQMNTFSPDVSEGWRNLISDLYEIEPFDSSDAKYYVYSLLKEMHKNSKCASGSIVFSSVRNQLKEYVATHFLSKDGIKVNNYFDLSFVEYVITCIRRELGFRAQRFVAARYGLPELLGYEGETEQEVLNIFDLTVEKGRQIRQQAIKSLRAAIGIDKLVVTPISRFIDIKVELEDKKNQLTSTQNELVSTQNALAQFTAMELGKKVAGTAPAHLLVSLESLDFSVRAYNCLKFGIFSDMTKKINNLLDLVLCTPEELLQLRNFGSKSLAEVEMLLEEKNLRLGMTLEEVRKI